MKETLLWLRYLSTSQSLTQIVEICIIDHRPAFTLDSKSNNNSSRVGFVGIILVVSKVGTKGMVRIV